MFYSEREAQIGYHRRPMPKMVSSDPVLVGFTVIAGNHNRHG